MEDHYRAWFVEKTVQRFARKTVADFFRSETYFLEQIGPQVGSVLDIGCASGRFMLLLSRYAPGCRYTGIDLVPDNIELARREFCDAEFLVRNGLDLSLGRTFDLVNATGVLQEEPRWEELLGRMVSHSQRYVLFDVKLSAMAEDIVDRRRSYVNLEGERLYFVVLSAARFLAVLRGLRGIDRAWVYGYETPVNSRTIVPPGVKVMVSAGVLLEKGPTGGGRPDVRIELPESVLPPVSGAQKHVRTRA